MCKKLSSEDYEDIDHELPEDHHRRLVVDGDCKDLDLEGDGIGGLVEFGMLSCGMTAVGRDEYLEGFVESLKQEL